jgi:hypothetical protein
MGGAMSVTGFPDNPPTCVCAKVLGQPELT